MGVVGRVDEVRNHRFNPLSYFRLKQTCPKNSLSINSEDVGERESGNELSFDAFINKTLDAQEQVAPTQSNEVLQRAVRVETFYSNITLAYEKPATHQFELTA